MSRQRLSIVAASLLMASPLAAQWQDCFEFPNIYNAPYLDDDCKNHFYAELDYLLWFAKQDGLSYATTQDFSRTISPTAFNGITSISISEDDRFLQNKWDSGVRAAIGFKPRQRTWDAKVIYTYFETDNSPGRVTTDSPVNLQNLISSYLPDSEFSRFAQVSFIPTNQTNWKLAFNQIDLEIGREFFTIKDATFRPFIGMRGLWTFQHLEITSLFLPPVFGIKVGEIDRVPTLFNFDNLTMDGRSHFYSFGAKAGFDINYTVFKDLELFGSFAGNILWGHFKVNQNFKNFSSTTVLSQIVAQESYTHSHHASVLNLDVALGIKWSCWINNHRNRLTFDFGWEQHIYTNMNQFQNTIFESSDTVVSYDRNNQRGTLFLQGFTLGASIYY